MKIVIPMAGRGMRFLAEADKNPEYKKPKPLIRVKGKPMIVWAVESFPFVDLLYRPTQAEQKVLPKNLVFIALQSHQEKYQIADKLRELFSSRINVILISKVTRGAVETALAAKGYLSDSEDVIIADSDQYIEGIHLYRAIQAKDSDTVGIIPVDRPIDEEIKHSYTLVDENGVALAVAEKDPKLAAKGAYSNIGAYYFASGKLFVDEAEEMIQAGDMYGPPERKEFYVAPLYQRLIDKGLKVRVVPTPVAWRLGTPKDLAYFEKHYQG